MEATQRQPGVRVRRFETRALPHIGDARGAAATREAHRLGVSAAHVDTARVYLVEADLTEQQADRLLAQLLTDPAREMGLEGAEQSDPSDVIIEVHPLPGVMDPAARTVEQAATSLLGLPPGSIRVSTGWRFDIAGATAAGAMTLATQSLANSVIEHIHAEPWLPDVLPHGALADQSLRIVPLRRASDDELTALSTQGHLFLNLQEMQAIREHFRELNREPTDVELETIAQTWSEHCVHKTLKSDVRYAPPEGDSINWSNRPGCTFNTDGTVRIENLLKSTVAAATHELIADGIDWTLSVFVDNSGVIAFDDKHAV